MVVMRWIAVALTGLLLMLGCSEQDPTTPPSDWEATETRWWQEDLDTSEVFRDLEDLTTMGVLEEEITLSQGQSVDQEQFNRAIKQSLLLLYRNDPETIDSLFEEHAVPHLQQADLSGDVVQENGQLQPKLLQNFKKKAYEAIGEHYREPQREESASVQYPDSLRSEETSGEVRLQVRVNEDGQVDAVEVLEGVHPTLDAISMNAARQTAWQAAHVLQDGEWEAQPAWARFSINYQS